MTTVWDGEVAGMAEGLASVQRNGRGILILADSKAAIAAVRKAGRTGKRDPGTSKRWWVDGIAE